MTSDDPWASIAAPASENQVSGLRVDPSHRWSFFWARDADKRCLLILKHDKAIRPMRRLPRFRGLEIAALSTEDGSHSMLLLRLTSREHRDIFHRLCLDIVSAARHAITEEDAVERFLARTWRWHHLLRGGPPMRLGAEEQKGLIGEITVLRRHLLPRLSPHDALMAWTGPLTAPKDFEIGRVAIEAKARRGAATPWVAISSEHQLDESGVEALFLHVLDVDAAPEGAEDAVMLPDVVAEFRESVIAADPSAELLLEERLQASGFEAEHDYTEFHWIIGFGRFFRVEGAFPRITPSSFGSGVSKVRYAVSLPECERYRVSDDVVHDYLERMSHVHDG